MDGAEPGGVVEEGDFVVSCDRATARVNARLGLVDEEDLAGEAADGRRGGARGGCCRVETGEVLTTPPPRTAKCRALRSRRVVKSSELKSTRSGTSDVMKTPKT